LPFFGGITILDTMMSDDDMSIIGEQLGEIGVLFLAVVNALRKQPGFDDVAFRLEIQRLLVNPSITQLQRDVLAKWLSDDAE
jgi:hypothetical protein